MWLWWAHTFFQQCGIGVGKLALAGLLAEALPARSATAGSSAPSSPLAARPGHLPGRAKAVIQLFMAGAPSQLDMFDFKPKLAAIEGRPIPPEVIGGQRYAFIRPDAAVLGPQFRFARHGGCDPEISEALPHLARVVDDIAIVRSGRTDRSNHAPAQIFMNCGFSQPGRPSMGSWVTYGLGSESNDLPAFIVMSTGGGVSGGSANWSSGFLPSIYSGTRFRKAGSPILNVESPDGADRRLETDTLEALTAINRRQLAIDGDPEIVTRIASYEMAHRLQTSAPDLMNLADESAEPLVLYGCKPKEASFARACLIARRLVERGVRFITIYHEGWDGHTDVAGNVRGNCGATERGSAALILDLKRRRLLDSTLVVWGGEFGRTPMVEASAVLKRSKGRDHHPNAFTMWLAGGGIKGGIGYGETDELGFHVARDEVHVHDLQATIMHCLGLDHERLTYRYQGRDVRLTDVHGHIVSGLLA
ncbi:MAG: DUF1501 domain-containing protein [Planctomycetia bacterium]|nr:DUF1501 domain-containing protein [Planctomycetia bacterium]